ncbi:TYRO protein tyrosine kinase-binding protein [Hoplias malabaricus]|uniref:TYRO protein tyrosine kinase-binding protein n=1 Tax=Hoplias malabaricus TaxID=27720 RepID=UPI0034621BAF
MSWTWRFMALGLFGSAAAHQDCGSCYQINMGMVIGIIVCDLIITLLIAISVYCFATRQKKKSRLHTRSNSCDPGKGKLRQSSSRPKEVEITESPYQELYGVQSDVYNDLRQYRK